VQGLVPDLWGMLRRGKVWPPKRGKRGDGGCHVEAGGI
jgi:hypothetical protein